MSARVAADSSLIPGAPLRRGKEGRSVFTATCATRNGATSNLRRLRHLRSERRCKVDDHCLLQSERRRKVDDHCLLQLVPTRQHLRGHDQQLLHDRAGVAALRSSFWQFFYPSWFCLLQHMPDHLVSTDARRQRCALSPSRRLAGTSGAAGTSRDDPRRKQEVAHPIYVIET